MGNLLSLCGGHRSIKYTQIGQLPSHPATNKPAHPNYSPNVFNDCYG